MQKEEEEEEEKKKKEGNLVKCVVLVQRQPLSLCLPRAPLAGRRSMRSVSFSHEEGVCILNGLEQMGRFSAGLLSHIFSANTGEGRGLHVRYRRLDRGSKIPRQETLSCDQTRPAYSRDALQRTRSLTRLFPGSSRSN